MLVLSRQKNESIWIGESIEVVVVDIRAGRVRLGFRCPSNVAIDRSEVRERMAISGVITVAPEAERNLAAFA